MSPFVLTHRYQPPEYSCLFFFFQQDLCINQNVEKYAISRNVKEIKKKYIYVGFVPNVNGVYPVPLCLSSLSACSMTTLPTVVQRNVTPTRSENLTDCKQCIIALY